MKNGLTFFKFDEKKFTKVDFQKWQKTAALKETLWKVATFPSKSSILE